MRRRSAAKAERRRIELRAAVLQIGPEPVLVVTRVVHPVSHYTRIKSLLYQNKLKSDSLSPTKHGDLLMRVFVTGATGFIGSAVVKELIAAGHQVIGLYRSDDKAPALAAAGAEVYRGSIDDPDSLKEGAARSDGVIHLAFNHDFSQFAANCEDDRRVIEALGSVLAGSDRPLIVTSGTAIANVAPGQLATEDAPAIVGPTCFPARLRRRRPPLPPRTGSMSPWFGCPQVHDPDQAGPHHPRDRDRSRKGRVRLYRRGTQSLARGARFRCGPPLQAGDRKGGAEARGITRSRKKACRCAISPKPSADAWSCRSNPSRRRRREAYFGWLAHVCRARHARLKRTDAEKARMANRPGPG